MAKRALKLSIRIPPYHAPRNEWRRKIHRAVLRKLKGSTVAYDGRDKFEVEIRLYMNDSELSFHDVDNRLKDILDALQGRAGGPKKIRTLAPIILNDNQIYRVMIEKAPPPWQSKGFGHLTIRRYRR